MWWGRGWITVLAASSKQQRGHLFHFCRLIPCNNPSELPANSHWPFLPERDCKQPTFDCDEMENLRTAYDVTDDNMDETLIKNINMINIIIQHWL